MSSYRPSGAGAPAVSIDPGAHAPAGHPAVLRVHVRNLADAPRAMTLTVLGLDGDWLPAPVRTGPVPADATITVQVHVPIAPGAVPGSYPFALAVEAHDAAGTRHGTTMLEGELRVDAPGTVLLSVEPAEAHGVFGRSVAVVLSNSGDQPVPLTLATRVDKGMRIRLDSDRVTVPPRTTVRLPARLSVNRPQVVGHISRRRYSVEGRGDQAPARFTGTLTTRPLIGATFMRIMAMVVVVAVWATGVLIGVPWLSQQLTRTQLEVDDAIVAVDGDGGADDGGADDGSGSGSGGAEDGDQDEDADDGRETVRIGGLITGSDPAGVQVDIAPASVLDLDVVAVSQQRTAEAGGSGGGGRALAMSAGPVARAVPAAATVTDPRPLGKVPAGALPYTRTDVLDAARRTSTGEDGTWAFAGLSPTTNYLITLSKPGYQTQRYVMSGAEAAAAPLEVELVAGAGRLTGRVTGPDGPAGGVDVTITDGQTTVTTSTRTSGEVGAWSVDGLSTPSTYLVTASGPGLGAQSALVELTAGGSERVDLRLHTSVASLTGRVTGRDSLGALRGLGGVTVTATDGTVTRTASTVTAGQVGTFVLADLPVPATYTVTISGDGYAPQTREVRLTAGRASSRLDVQLGTASAVVQGTVRDVAKAGIGSAGLTLSNGEQTYKTMSASDADGSFRFNGIEPGTYVLEAEAFGHLTGHTSVTVEAGGTATADVVLTPIEGDGLVQTSRIRGRASDARTNGQIACTGLAPGEPCELTVTMTAQNLDGTTRHIEVRTSPDLEYTIPPANDPVGLLPGLYTLTISAPGYEPGTVSVQVPMDRTVTASQVALYPAPSIVGTVLARVGAVPADTCVVAAPEGTPPAAVGDCDVGTDAAGDPTCTITGAAADVARCAGIGLNGSYSIERLSSGQFTVFIRPGDDEYLPVDPVSISLAPGDVRRYDATLDRLGRVSLTVLADLGTSALRPADDAEVTPIQIALGAPGGGYELDPVRTDDDGQALVTHLPVGTYRFEILWQTSPDGGAAVDLTATSADITVGRNQEITHQVVLTRTRTAFQGRVVTHLGASGEAAAGGVTVRLNGITGYRGLVPVWGQAEVVTDEFGNYAVVPNQAEADASPVPAAVLPLASDEINIEVVGADYEPYSASGVRVSELIASPIEIQPRGQQFAGVLRLVGAPPDVDPTDVEFHVEQAPPRAAGAQVRVGSHQGGTTWALTWNDLAQPAAGAGAGSGTLIRPGRYRVTATLDGYDPVTRTFDVAVGSPVAPAIDFELRRHGRLQVAVYAGIDGAPCNPSDLATCAQVRDPVITLSRPSGSVTLEATPGRNVVDFGTMASGTYEVVVQAAGHRFTTHEVTLDPGQSAPVPVVVERLGVITGTVEVVSDTGRDAVAGVEVLVVRGDQEFTATTNAVGQYRVTGTVVDEGLEPGPWEVSVSVPGYTTQYPVGDSYTVVIPAMGSRDVLQDVELRADPVDLWVDIYDPDTNEGVADLQVRLHTPQGPLTPLCPGPAPVCDAQPGRYLFAGVTPGSYTLDVSGGNYAPLIVPVHPVAGVPSQIVRVPIAPRMNTVIGTVSGQAGAAMAIPLTTADHGAAVELRLPGEVDAVHAVDVVAGAFMISDVADGSYELWVDANGYNATTRSISVHGGQLVSVDVVLYTDARQVTVTVESEQGFDLTGALVSLLPVAPGELPLAAQPVVRTAPGARTYATTFNQVPPGQWTARVSGPTGHHGTFSATIGDGDDAVTILVDEIRVRLAASSPLPDAPATLPLQVFTGNNPNNGDLVVEETVGVGTGATLVYLPRPGGGGTAYTVVPDAPGGWDVTPGTISVPRTASDVPATFVLTKEPVATTTTLSAPATVDDGASVTLTATVSPAPDGGTVEFYRGTGPGRVLLGQDTVVDDEASLTVSTAGWGAGPHQVTAEFSGASGFAASTSTAATVTVQVPTTTTLTPATQTVELGQPATFTVTVGPAGATGTVRVYRSVPGPDELVGQVVLPGSTLTWTPNQPSAVGDHEFYAELTGSGGYKDSSSDTVTVTVEAPPDPDD